MEKELKTIIECTAAKYPSIYREDLIQECYLTALPMMDKYDPAQKLSTYLYKRLNGACIDFIKANRSNDLEVQDNALYETPTYNDMRLEVTRVTITDFIKHLYDRGYEPDEILFKYQEVHGLTSLKTIYNHLNT